MNQIETAKRLGKVAVMLGGTSAERPVSLNSGHAVLAALQRQGVDAHAFDPANRNLADLISAKPTQIRLRPLPPRPTGCDPRRT